MQPLRLKWEEAHLATFIAGLKTLRAEYVSSLCAGRVRSSMVYVISDYTERPITTAIKRERERERGEKG